MNLFQGASKRILNHMGAVKKSKKQAEIYLTLCELNPYMLNLYVLNLGR
jgi:hypothetical protein